MNLSSPYRLVLSFLGLSMAAASQSHAQTSGRSEIFAGSELESYIRLLQIDGRAALYPWSIRSFSPREVDRLLAAGADHPWSAHFDLGPSHGKRIQFDLVRPSLTTSVNSTFPWGSNDGPVWAGRGVTASVQAGFAARYGPISLTVAPRAFSSQNAAFDLQPNGQTGDLRFADGRSPTNMDRPQRFGSGVYSRLDPGQSTFRVDLPVVAFGASTANQYWGPASQHPILLGNNAAGFPHLFLGSSSPLDLGIVKVHGRLVWGKLSQSDYTSITGSARRRFMSGIIGLITPKGFDGLELGAARFFHQAWPEDGLSLNDFTKQFESILKSSLENSTDNQIASVFARWAFPRSGFEIYAEYGREDHNWDFRDLILEPDHSGGYMLGITKILRSSPESFYAIRAETMNLQVSQLIGGRSEGPFYRHSRTRQGHTERGQILGSAAGAGGNATLLAVDRYHSRGRWTAFWSRELRQDVGTFWQTGVRTSPGFDVQHALGGEALFFGDRFDITAGVTAVYNLNRDLGGDAFNLNATFSLRSNFGWARPHRGALEDGPTPSGNSVPSLPRWRNPPTAHTTAQPLVLVSGDIVERQRLDELIGHAEPNTRLLQSTSGLTQRLDAPRKPRFAVLAPEAEMVQNSGIPFSLNRGNLWAGRGRNILLRAGFQADWGPVSLIVAPEFTYSENQEFSLGVRLEVLRHPFNAPVLEHPRDSLADPLYVLPNSIDRPFRFGDTSFRDIHAGQSTLAVHTGVASFGISTENEWWGPGIRNAIVLSNHAPGFVHFFARTDHPVKTPVGEFAGRLLLGGLRESSYFDSLSTNDWRSFSALAMTWNPPGLDGLILGATRAVYQPVAGATNISAHLFDALFSFPGRPNDRPVDDTTQVPGPDQIYSLFGRWVFPRSGFEVYGEWSRTELPASFRDLLEAPGHTQGYTLGLQWARALHEGRDAFRIQAEHTYLEKSTTFRDRPVGTYYTSRTVPQGYTNQGRVLGAGIGPGSSSHWLALDYFSRNWEIGAFGERIRWNNDALFDIELPTPSTLPWCKHDVTIRGGIRGAYSFPFGRVRVSLSQGKRMNAYFNHFTVCGRDADPLAITDIRTTTLELKYSFR